jgi:hypothetical protein
MRSKTASADGTALAGTFDHKQTTVDLAGLGDDLAEVLEAAVAADVAGVVDDSLDTKGPPLFQVLRDAAVLVTEVHADVGAGREDPGSKDPGRVLADLAGEHSGDLVGSADADIVGHEGLEERPGPSGVVEDQGAADLGLAQRQLPPVAARLVFSGQGRGDDRHPSVEEPLHVARPEPVADGLEGGGVGAGREAVGQLGETNTVAGGLAFGPLVPVDPHLGGVGPGKPHSEVPVVTDRPFSVRLPSEPRGHLSMHVALQ